VTLYISPAFLVLGLICKRAGQAGRSQMADPGPGSGADPDGAGPALRPYRGLCIGGGAFDWKAALAWLAVGLPLAWGVFQTLTKALIIFK